MTRPKAPPVVDVDRKAVEQMLERAKAVLLSSDFEILAAIVVCYVYLVQLVRSQRTTIARLRRFVGFSTSEKLAGVTDKGETSKPSPDAATPGAAAPPGGETPPGADETGAGVGAGGSVAAPEPAKGAEGKPKKQVKGHGRVPASAYGAARHIAVPHASLHVGGRCPDGCPGRLYQLREPAKIVRIFGQAPLFATCWDCEQLRCNTCGNVHKARAPEEAQGEKYDATAASMMALLTYDMGVPFYRLGRLQRVLQTPVPASTQWEVLDARKEMFQPVHALLEHAAAQGAVLYNDDSHKGILELMGKRRDALLAKSELPDPERTGLFTTAIVSTADTRPPIVLFYTGRRHAGENLDRLLDKRDPSLPPPIQMGDALTRNVPENHDVVESNCLTHGRRKIVDEIPNYPAECRELLEKIAGIYKVDAICKKKKLSPQERLEEHQRVSGPLMEELKRLMEEHLAQKRVEPNSGIGEAFHYLLKRWDKFTLFLREPGAPLDNNRCERALKTAIRHRNASLFYRSQRSASVGDMYMSIIHTTELCGGNPFDYLTALQRHHKLVAEKPAEWLPWNYQETLARMGARDPPRQGAARAAATTPHAPSSPDITLPQAA
jgi:transposase